MSGRCSYLYSPMYSSKIPAITFSSNELLRDGRCAMRSRLRSPLTMIAEIASAVLLVVPRFAAYGASVFAIVMLGAIYTHATHGESSRLPFNFLLLAFSIIIMIGRHPSLLTRLRQYKKS